MNPAAPSIHCSAERGNLEQVRTLLDQGVTVESRDKLDRTPLMVACSKGRLEVARMLLEFGADSNAADAHKHSVLHFAATSRECRLVPLLVRFGSNVFAVNSFGATPLLEAACYGMHNNVRWLLWYGSNTEQKDKNGSTAIDHAVEHNRTLVLKVFELNSNFGSAIASGLESSSSSPWGSFLRGALADSQLLTCIASFVVFD